jgi:hypothetical protein
MVADLTGPTLLRAAAKAMRDKATASTQGPWELMPWTVSAPRYTTYMVATPGETEIADCRPEPWLFEDGDQPVYAANGYHIAAWHPGVALAVADWLDSEAESWDGDEADIAYLHPYSVARVFLGDSTQEEDE